MFFKRTLLVLTTIASLAIVAISFTHQSGHTPGALPVVVPEPRNSISNLQGGDGQVLVVKIDDTRPAHPQIGVEDADIVYIEQVEGGLTRLAAIFSSKIPMRIGPIRSARISDLELLSQYGHIAFAYSGAQQKLRPLIAAANLQDLGAQHHSSVIYTRDVNRIQPYAMVLRADLLMNFISEKNFEIAQSHSMGWKFGDAPAGGIDITAAHIYWPASSYDAKWSMEENRWLLDYAGQADISDSGFQLGPSTFIIQLVSITDSIYKDKVGGITPFSQTIGSGVGYILRDGKYFPAMWSRSDESSGTSWKSSDGREINFATGQIWVALTDNEPIFTIANADARNQSTK